MLEIEKDLPLTAEEFLVMRAPSSRDPQDLAAYPDFLEAVGAFESKKAEARLYAEEFLIDGVLPDERHVLYRKCTETLLNT
jgi:hypothetical protein